MRPIYDDQDRIIGMEDENFLERLPEVLYRLINFKCKTCNAGFLMDFRFVTENSIKPICPICGAETEAVSATRDETSDELESWGCAYPSSLTWEQEWDIRQRLREQSIVNGGE